MLSVAMPKGRMSKKAYKLFSAAGLSCSAMEKESRKLVFTDGETGVSYALIKPSDVAVYVERGAMDIGVVGKDVLLETQPDVYELMDLSLGKCELCVAAPAGYREDYGAMTRVATKYPNVARAYYRERNRDIEIIKLSGSIELAPIIGLADVIVDIVETGSTLRANNLHVISHIAPCSARLIANKKSMKFRQGEIAQLMSDFTEVLQNPYAHNIG